MLDDRNTGLCVITRACRSLILQIRSAPQFCAVTNRGNWRRTCWRGSAFTRSTGLSVKRWPVSNHRPLDIAEGQVDLPLQGYHHDAQQKTIMQQAEEFIRRFLLHVLPDGFRRIRYYYGFLGNRYRERKLAHCRELLGMPTPQPSALEIAKDYRETYEELTGSSLWQCPVCRQGRMLLPRCPQVQKKSCIS
jgi:hypothetical protein